MCDSACRAKLIICGGRAAAHLTMMGQIVPLADRLTHREAAEIIAELQQLEEQAARLRQRIEANAK